MPGISAPSFSHSSRERSAAASSPRARPDTQTRPKLRTVAPARLGLALELDDLVAAADRLQGVRGAEDAAPDDRHPHGADPSESLATTPRPAGVARAEQQVNNWYRPISGTLSAWPCSTKSVLLLRSLRGVWDEDAVDELDHALQAAARAIDDGADDELVLAAALHDLGHSPLFGDDRDRSTTTGSPGTG